MSGQTSQISSTLSPKRGCGSFRPAVSFWGHLKFQVVCPQIGTAVLKLKAPQDKSILRFGFLPLSPCRYCSPALGTNYLDNLTGLPPPWDCSAKKGSPASGTSCLKLYLLLLRYTVNTLILLLVVRIVVDSVGAVASRPQNLERGTRPGGGRFRRNRNRVPESGRHGYPGTQVTLHYLLPF